MARYATLEVTLILLLGLALTAAVGYYFSWWAAIAPGLLTLALLSFYRDPPRVIPAGAQLLLSPADGTIMSVERGWSPPEGGPQELRICIFLSVANVHVNRTPCAGHVRAVVYRKGLFLNALKVESTLRNENNLMTLDPAAPLPGPIHVRQIAGLLARRIICTLKPGDAVAAGERFGMIKLGSQTEIRVPEDPHWDVRVRPRQSVKGGLTVLAEWKSSE
jgi:phosphatidylserine decarboxylase